MLKEIGDLAGQREMVSENLQAQVLTKISLLSKELRDDRKVNNILLTIDDLCYLIFQMFDIIEMVKRRIIPTTKFTLTNIVIGKGTEKL